MRKNDLSVIGVYSSLCVGCGMCVSIAPEVFEFDSDGKSKLILKNIETKKAKEYVNICPVQAIIIK
ncbi:MAG: ferredoxin [Oscillospiraceae bacterium]|jgi:ferredoxin|nr:ferredoxin [Oscillospiraceae bacterium]